MLDEEEFAQIDALYQEALAGAKQFREQSGLSLDRDAIDAYFAPVIVRYQELTGVDETNHVSILHHRISLYGPPCKRCHKPLRTPNAKLCGSCMMPVEPNHG
ncbi:MAG: hypothetical protein P4L40_11975 [Terracidiphilus sp.]|nr:hypothetical protein [Terracidiphilus sp.]